MAKYTALALGGLALASAYAPTMAPSGPSLLARPALSARASGGAPRPGAAAPRRRRHAAFEAEGGGASWNSCAQRAWWRRRGRGPFRARVPLHGCRCLARRRSRGRLRLGREPCAHARTVGLWVLASSACVPARAANAGICAYCCPLQGAPCAARAVCSRRWATTWSTQRLPRASPISSAARPSCVSTRSRRRARKPR